VDEHFVRGNVYLRTSESRVRPGGLEAVARAPGAGRGSVSYLGIRGFDSILRGGIPARAEVLLLVPEGADRYVLGAHWCVEGLQRGERVLLVLSGESPDAFLARLGRMGIDVTASLASGALVVVDWHTCWTQAVEGVAEDHRRLRASRTVEDLVAAIERGLPSLLPAPNRRAFVDVLPIALKALDEMAATEALASIRAPLAEAGVTSVFVGERGMPEDRANALLQSFHAVLDVRREGPEALAIGVLGVGGVKLTSRYRRVRVREDAAFVEAEPTVRTFSCPICDARVPFDVAKCPSCGTPRSDMAVRARPSGIMDYVESLGRKDVEDRARVSAAPSQPRPPGFTNGVRGPAGRVNGTAAGKVNGTGRVNGTAPRGRTNGLQTGPGRTNGLVNGLVRARGGITNGLTNGSGFTNGLGGARARSEARRSRWRLYLVPLLAASLLIAPFLLTEPESRPRFSIDGSFGEWQGISGFAQTPPPGTDPSVALTEWKVVNGTGTIHLFARVAGSWFDDPDAVEALYVFIDADGRADTGYAVQGLGANVLATVEGTAGAVTAGSLREYADGTDPHNWSGWVSSGSISAAISEGQLEASIPLDGDTDPTIFLLAEAEDSRVYSAVAFALEGGALRATVSGRANIVSRGTPDVVAVDLQAFGGPVTVTGLRVDTDGIAAIMPPGFPITLEAGKNRTVTVRLDTSQSPDGTLLAARVVGVDTNPPRPFTILGGTVRAFVESAPAGKVVDGWFGDWGPELTGDTGPAANPDRDIDRFAANRTGSVLFLYVDVRGQVFAGSPVPVHRTKPTPGNPQPSAPAPPSRTVGEDIFRVYVDMDRTVEEGAPTLGLVGADLLLELRGIQGTITGRRAFEWRDGWRPLAGPPAENDAQRAEASLPLPLAANAIEVVFESRGWDGVADTTPVSGTRGVRGSAPGVYRSEGKFTTLFTADGRIQVSAGDATLAWTLPSPPDSAGGSSWSVSPTPVGVTYSSVSAEVRYSVQAAQLKEEFVFLSPPRELSALEFPFELGGSAMLWLEDGGPPRIVSDAGRVFELGAPFAVDADDRVWPLVLDVDMDARRFRIPVPADLLTDATYPLVIDPIVNYTLENDGASDDPAEWLGYSTAIGDFNGDGYADVLTGAPNNNKNNASLTTGHGYAYVFYGPFSANDASPDVWINPQNLNTTRFGYSVAAGNFNGDAYWDALVSRVAIDTLAIGNTSIYYGSASWSGEETTPDVQFVPPSAPKNFGWSVAAGNLDNANSDDVLISEEARDTDGGLSSQDGFVYVYKSPFSAVESSWDYRLWPSTNASGHFGRTIAVGKIDSDAYADVVVGESVYSSSTGRIHFFKGVQFVSGSGNRYPNATISAPSGGGSTVQFGAALALGRLNTDAYLDLLVGAPLFGSGEDGRAYVFLANSDGSGLSGGAAPSVTLTGGSGEQFGTSVVIADWAGDGTADAFVGAPRAAGGGTDRGKAYWFNNPLADTTADATWTGEANTERLGQSLAAGKFSNNPLTVLAIGAYLWDGASDTDSGRVVVSTIPEPAEALVAGAVVLVPALRWVSHRRRRR